MQSVCINVLMSIVGDCESTACKSSSDSGPRVLSEEIPQKCYPQTLAAWTLVLLHCWLCSRRTKPHVVAVLMEGNP